VLCQKNYDVVYLRCLEKEDVNKALSELHDGHVGGNFGGDTTINKVLRDGYYWPTLFKDSHAYARKFPECQKASGREKKPGFPLHMVTIKCPFQQWGLYVIGEINSNSCKLHKYIITTTYYFTRWTKEIPLNIVNEDQVISFLESHIITRFGVPEYLVFDNAKYFSSLKLTEYTLERNIKPNIQLIIIHKGMG